MDWRSRSQRRKAFNTPGHAHELTFCCYRRFNFLRSEQTCAWLAQAIDTARQELDFALWAYVFMPDHVHLIVYPRQPEYDVGLILQGIKEPVAREAIRHIRLSAPQWLPRITVQRGQRRERRFWQAGGGYDRNNFEPKVLLAMIDYLHGNPVRRGLVERPEDWRWSSAGWTEGKNPLRPDILDLAGFCLYLDGYGG